MKSNNPAAHLESEFHARKSSLRSFILVSMSTGGICSVTTDGDKTDIAFMERLLGVVVSGQIAADISKQRVPDKEKVDA